VIQPQVPLRYLVYDFTQVTSHSLGPPFPCGLGSHSGAKLTPMV